MEPPPASSMWGMAKCIPRQTLVKLVLSVRFQSSSEISATLPGMATAALLTRISSRPKRATVAAISASTSAVTPYVRTLKRDIIAALGQRLDLGLAPSLIDIAEHDRRAGPGQRRGRCLADACGRAGYDGDLVVECSHGSLLMVLLRDAACPRLAADGYAQKLSHSPCHSTRPSRGIQD